MPNDSTTAPADQSSAKPYRTSDMYIAAYLMYAKANFLRVEKESPNSNRSFFLFEKTPGFEKLVAEYFNGKGMVAANVFAAKIRDVKTLTHSG